MMHVDAQGAHIPKLGFGTWQMEGRVCRDAVGRALSVGFRHIDTAQMYGNEAEVGAALRDTTVPRDDIFVTTKIWYEELAPDRVHATTRASLKRLGLDHVDLLLIHWPNREVPLADTLGAMMDLVGEGCVRYVGVSNFTPKLIEQAMSLAPIVCNQVEYHPFLAQADLIDIARATSTALTAYCPLAQGGVLDSEVLRAIGERHDKSAAQVTLRWQLQQTAVVTIPKAATAEHIASNFDVFDFELDDEEMAAIHDLARGERLIAPSHAPRWGESPSRSAASWRMAGVAPGTAPETPSRHTAKSQQASPS